MRTMHLSSKDIEFLHEGGRYYLQLLREAGVPTPLNFDELRAANAARCEAVFHPLKDWTPLEWAGAAAGELGEAANKTKKIRRGEKVPLDDLGDELADVIMYLDLWAASLGIDLGAAVVRKFDAVSKKKKSKIFLGLPPKKRRR